MSNTAPFEIIHGPIEVYIAPTGTAFPDVDEAPSGSWTLFGASGAKNIDNEGLTISHPQTIERDAFRMLGTTGARKAVRTDEDLMIAFTLYDLTAEMYSYALNGNAVLDTAAGAGTPGTRIVNLHQGADVAVYALLVRGEKSPYGDGWNMQYCVPVCYQNGSPEVVYSKDGPAGLAFEFVALEDPDAVEGEEFGYLEEQDATAV